MSTADAAVVYRSKWETLQQQCRHLLLSEIDASNKDLNGDEGGWILASAD